MEKECWKLPQNRKSFKASNSGRRFVVIFSDWRLTEEALLCDIGTELQVRVSNMDLN